MEIVKDKNKSLTHSAYGLYVHLNVAKGDTLTAIKYIDTLAIQAKTFKSFPKYHEAILNKLLAFKQKYLKGKIIKRQLHFVIAEQNGRGTQTNCVRSAR